MSAERKFAVEGAAYWFNSARRAQREHDMGEALACMENAFNHTENALFAAAASDEVKARIRDAERSARSTRRCPANEEPTMQTVTAYKHERSDKLFATEQEARREEFLLLMMDAGRTLPAFDAPKDWNEQSVMAWLGRAVSGDYPSAYASLRAALAYLEDHYEAITGAAEPGWRVPLRGERETSPKARG